MELIRHLHVLKPQHQNCAITLGNFDGVHLGHQKMLTYLAEQAKQRNLSTQLIIFEPQPKEFFKAEHAPARLTSLREKLYYLNKLPLDYVLCLHFNKAIADMKAEDFITQILFETLHVKYLLIGEDFRFGRNRMGDRELLQNAGKRYGFTVETMPKIMAHDERISSTLVREYLRQGNLDLAGELLGRCYSMCGRIVHGDKRGRVLGFPTANVYRKYRKAPMTGIFAVKMHGLNKIALPGVANLGVRPMFALNQHLLEVYLLDFNQDLYGKYVRVDFLAKLRDELNFDSVDALKEQIDNDVANARKYFHSTTKLRL